MTTNYRMEGRVLDWTNATGADIASGEGVNMAAGLFGIAMQTIKDTEEGPVAIVNVFRVTKTAGDAFVVGDSVYYDAGPKTYTVTDTGVRAGRCSWPSPAAQTYVDVLLNQPA